MSTPAGDIYALASLLGRRPVTLPPMKRPWLAYWKCEARRHLRSCNDGDTCREAEVARAILARRLERS